MTQIEQEKKTGYRGFERAELSVIEESCRSMSVWFPMGGEIHSGKQVFVHRSTGHKAIVNGVDRMRRIY